MPRPLPLRRVHCPQSFHSHHALIVQSRFHLGVFALLALVTGGSNAQAPGTLTVVAGTGRHGFTGDGGPAIQARLNAPEGLAVDSRGNLFIADSLNHRIRRVTPGGIISTVAGTGFAGFGGDGGFGVSTALTQPEGVTLDASGDLFIVDYGSHRLRRLAFKGRILPVAGGKKGYTGDGMPAPLCALRSLIGATVDRAGNLYLADADNHRVRRVTPDGVIATFAGDGSEGYSGDGGPATAAQLDYPTDVATDAEGNVYFCDSLNAVVRRVDPQGVITTVAGIGLAGDSGDGGPATSAALDDPTDIALDSAGNLFIADSFNHRVRRVGPDGIIVTVAGTGEPGASGEEGPATQAQLNLPLGVEVDSAGNLYIADGENHRVVRVSGVAAPALPPGRFTPGSGDLNGDGVINVQDAIAALRITVGQDATPVAKATADVTGDGRANVQDAILLLRIAVGL